MNFISFSDKSLDVLISLNSILFFAGCDNVRSASSTIWWVTQYFMIDHDETILNKKDVINSMIFLILLYMRNYDNE